MSYADISKFPYKILFEFFTAFVEKNKSEICCKFGQKELFDPEQNEKKGKKKNTYQVKAKNI